MLSLNAINQDLNIIKELVYDKCSFKIENFKQDAESAGYAACCFELNEKLIQYRLAKITPTKTGQFVTIWKRNAEGVTAPFDDTDHLDFIIITCRKEVQLGQFIFPVKVLVEKRIISTKNKEGKRGIRVYPPWDEVSSKQAKQTQSWQLKYFIEIKPGGRTDLEFVRNLLVV